MATPKCMTNCKQWSELLNRCCKCTNCKSDECDVCANRCEIAVFEGDAICPEFEIEDQYLEALANG